MKRCRRLWGRHMPEQRTRGESSSLLTVSTKARLKHFSQEFTSVLGNTFDGGWNLSNPGQHIDTKDLWCYMCWTCTTDHWWSQGGGGGGKVYINKKNIEMEKKKLLQVISIAVLTVYRFYRKSFICECAEQCGCICKTCTPAKSLWILLVSNEHAKVIKRHFYSHDELLHATSFHIFKRKSKRKATTSLLVSEFS